MGLRTDAEVAALAASGGGSAPDQRSGSGAAPDSEFSRRLAGKFSPRSPRMRALNPLDGGS